MAIIDPLFSILDCRECNRATLAYSVWFQRYAISYQPYVNYALVCGPRKSRDSI